MQHEGTSPEGSSTYGRPERWQELDPIKIARGPCWPNGQLKSTAVCQQTEQQLALHGTKDARFHEILKHLKSH